MGVKRNRARKAKKTGFPYDRKAEKTQSFYAIRNSGFEFTRLRDVLPNRGLIYPYASTITNHHRRDRAILAAIVTHVDEPKTADVEPLIVAMIDEATRMATAAGSMCGKDVEDFLEEVRTRNAVALWTKGVYAAAFRALILCLRAARINWREKPRSPFTTELDSPLGRIMEAFNNATAAMAWGGMDSNLVIWLRYGGMNPVRDPMKAAEDEEESLVDMPNEAKPVDTEEIKKITAKLAAVVVEENHSEAPASPIQAPTNGNASNHNASAESSAVERKPSRHYGVRSTNVKEIPTGALDEILKKLRLSRQINEMSQVFAKHLALDERTAEPLPCEDYIPLEDYSDEEVKDGNIEEQQEDEMDIDSGDF
ncbi:hypothetical protein B0T22DRAFT_533270 [Podospora appendiculata]|uniref:Uncharacterized protein n=1 Tax=Podospora appendiculata TaxID=314037 RepID=A0AAE1CHB8_9PEZI|nr:hypothetical protein B0T22DRAFT_533270 [Podospora appendiculata]